MKTLREAIRDNDFVVTAAIALQPGTTGQQVRQSIETLGPAVDAIQADDNRGVERHMSGLAVAGIALSQGVDCVVQLSCRDRNRIALQAEVLGAAALGVTSLLLMRGEKLAKTTRRPTRAVFELGASDLIDLANRVGTNNELVASPGFYLGSFVTAFKPDEGWQADRVFEKINAGSRFVQTQPCLNAGLIEAYVTRLVELKILHRASIIVEVPLLTSAASAKELKESFPGAPLPDPLLKRIAEAKDPVAEGVAVCAQLISTLREMPGVAGVNVVYDREAGDAVAAISASS